MVFEKEKSFSKAISFIDSRLAPLNNELDNIETENSIFKARKGFTGMSSNGTLYQQKMIELDKQLADIKLKRQTIQATENYLKNPESKDENMSLIGISDSYLQSLLIQFQKLRTDRIALAYRVTENNDDLKELDKLISIIKENIILQVGNYKRTIQLAENNYKALLQETKNLLSNTPTDEKILIDQERQQNIKEQMFLILLQKREEASIAKASVTSDTKVLKPALLPTEPISPDSNKILISFVLLSAILPIFFILVIELSNRKIISKNQLERLVEMPVIGDLEFDKQASENVVLMDKGGRTMFNEQIRSLRANLIFYRKPNQPLVILVTSSMSGEGKSFISTNLARSFSLLGEKTALIELDLRRPNISKRFNIPNTNGLSKVFTGQLNPDSIKVPLLETETLDLFPSGIIPPNPSELISSEHAENFMKYLHSNYDIVIIDTPPFGLVSDAQLAAKWCNSTLVITRFNKTVIEQVKNIQRWNQQKLFPSMAIVLNAIETKGYYGYNYGYYYYMKRKGYNYYSPSSVNAEEKEIQES
jgi:capsular exopolysaccharide synthesis family protein